MAPKQPIKVEVEELQERPTSSKSKAAKKRADIMALNEYKMLNKELNQFQEPELTNDGNEIIARHLKRTAMIYPKIHKKFHHSAADALHLKNLAILGTSVADKLLISNDLFDIKSFGKKLKRKLRELEGNPRVRYGEIINDCLYTAPIFEFVYGTFTMVDLAIKEKKARQKKEPVEVKEIVKASEKDMKIEVAQDGTPKEVDLIYKKLKRIVRTSEKSKPNLLESIIDFNSFNQTVENLFHLSFLVKESKVAIEESNEKKPIFQIVRHKAKQEENDESSLVRASTIKSNADNNQERHQSILSFTMADYKKWVAESGKSV